MIAAEEKTASGIVLPGTAKEKPQQGKVVAVGTGRVLENGQRIAVDVQVNDQVIFSKFSGTELKLDGKEYLVLREGDILGVL